MNTYTKGIRKIFDPDYYSTVQELCATAERVGYEACNHNGDVWVKTSPGSWVRSPFTIGDFNTSDK